MSLKPTSYEAYKLLHDGAIALADVEQNGIKIDTEYLDAEIERTTERIDKLIERLKADDTWTLWQKRFGHKANLGNHQQLAAVVFEELGHKRRKGESKTDKGQDKADNYAFAHLDLPFTQSYFEAERLKKARNTYLYGIRREMVDGYIHPFFNLHTTRTQRGSCDSPNVQNLPVRLEEIAAIIRRTVITPDGFDIGEFDFKTVEVRISACVNKDPVLIDYMRDDDKDMHKDAAAGLLKLHRDNVSDDTRSHVKNKYVFPTFYGSFYKQMAPSLWEAMVQFNLKTEAGVPLRTHLAELGIEELGRCDVAGQYEPESGTFERRVMEYERWFWKERYKGYDRWKRTEWERYQRDGFVEYLTGFVLWAILKKNDVLNWQIQGPAFHCLLWVLIQLQKWLRKNGMKSRIIGQIHDSIVMYIWRAEREKVLAKIKKLVTEELVDHWKWIIVPMRVDAAIAEDGKSWYEKKKVKL